MTLEQTIRDIVRDELRAAFAGPANPAPATPEPPAEIEIVDLRGGRGNYRFDTIPVGGQRRYRSDKPENVTIAASQWAGRNNAKLVTRRLPDGTVLVVRTA